MGRLSQDLTSLSKGEIEDIKERGLVVIKNVLPENGILALDMLFQRLLHCNYWAKCFPSLRLRSLLKAKKQSLSRRLTGSLRTILVSREARPENQQTLLASQCFVNSLCHSPRSPWMADTSVSLSYTDRFSVCQPDDAGFAFGAHIDGGSVEGWEDLEYSLL